MEKDKASSDDLVMLLTTALEMTWVSHQLNNIILLFIYGEDTEKKPAQWKLPFLSNLCKASKIYFYFLQIEFPSKEHCFGC